jgi:hypothetical protein
VPTKKYQNDGTILYVDVDNIKGSVIKHLDAVEGDVLKMFFFASKVGYTNIIYDFVICGSNLYENAINYYPPYQNLFIGVDESVIKKNTMDNLLMPHSLDQIQLSKQQIINTLAQFYSKTIVNKIIKIFDFVIDNNFKKVVPAIK